MPNASKETRVSGWGALPSISPAACQRWLDAIPRDPSNSRLLATAVSCDKNQPPPFSSSRLGPPGAGLSVKQSWRLRCSSRLCVLSIGIVVVLAPLAARGLKWHLAASRTQRSQLVLFGCVTQRSFCVWQRSQAERVFLDADADADNDAEAIAEYPTRSMALWVESCRAVREEETASIKYRVLYKSAFCCCRFGVSGTLVRCAG